MLPEPDKDSVGILLWDKLKVDACRCVCRECRAGLCWFARDSSNRACWHQEMGVMQLKSSQVHQDAWYAPTSCQCCVVRQRSKHLCNVIRNRCKSVVKTLDLHIFLCIFQAVQGPDQSPERVRNDPTVHNVYCCAARLDRQFHAQQTFSAEGQERAVFAYPCFVRVAPDSGIGLQERSVFFQTTAQFWIIRFPASIEQPFDIYRQSTCNLLASLYCRQ